MLSFFETEWQKVKRVVGVVMEEVEGFFAARQRGALFLLFLALMVGACTFLFSEMSIPFIDLFFVWWVLAVVVLRLSARVSLAVGLFFLSLCPLALLIDRGEVAERGAVLAYSLFLIGVFQLFIAVVLKKD